MTDVASEPITFHEKVSVRAPRGFSAALRLLAKQHNTGTAEWARQALLRSMAAEGVRLQGGEVVRVA